LPNLDLSDGQTKVAAIPSRLHLIFAISVVTVALAIGASAFYFASSARGPIQTGTALVGGPFSLLDHNSRRVSDRDFLGKYVLMFFGFTQCADICPTELQVMSAALDELGKDADKIQPVFVSIDPDRDTPEVLKRYVANFHPRLIGLTGSPGDVAAMAKTYRVYYRKVDSSIVPGDYQMDHSSSIYLMGPDGRFLKHFGYTTDARALADELRSAISG
jgi:cytochrome oxidase Cu insertion factor (SCO1/SenC/PrrC family)